MDSLAPPVGHVWCFCQLMSLEQWKHSFDSAAVDGVLSSPGAAGLSALCESNGLNCETEAVEEYLAKHGTPDDCDLNSAEWFGLLEHLGWQSEEEEKDNSE